MKLFSIYFLLILLFILPVDIISQQNKGKIYGSVEDLESENPIPFVNVLLLKEIDSSIVKAAATNKSGQFELLNIDDGDYLIKFSSIGFNELITPGIKIGNKGRVLNLGTTILFSSITDMDEVVITSEKSIFNNSIDRKIYNVEQDLMSKSGTAGDLLQNIPSVSVDIDGNVSLRGNQNVMIMINGKTSPMMNKNSASVLEGMPANLIERIEVITNPSAKFQPDGTSGIINIVLKKDRGTGFNSNATVNVGNKNRYNAKVNFNYHPGRLNVFGNYGFRKDDRGRIAESYRILSGASGVINYQDETNNFSGKPVFNLATLGFDYDFDQFNKMGITGNWVYQDVERAGNNVVVYSDPDFNVTESFSREIQNSEIEKEIDLTLNYNHNFGSENHDIDFEYKISRSPEEDNNKYSQYFTVPTSSVPGFENETIHQTDSQQELFIRYRVPFSEDFSLETGYEGRFNFAEKNVYADFFDYQSNSVVQNVNKSNNFQLSQDINSLYAVIQREFGEFGVSAGIRLENAVIKPKLITLNSEITNNYFNFFPTIHLGYKLTEAASLQLNYSQRVRRPDEDDLNPFYEYDDSRNIRAGNPNLLPQFTHSMEFGSQIQFENITFIPAIYYRYTTNRFTEVTSQLNDSTLITIPFNLETDKAGGVELIVSGSVSSLFNTQVSVNGFYNQISSSNLGNNIESSAWTWNGTFSLNFNITKTTMFQLNSRYRSLRLTPQGETSPSYSINCGIRQDLFDDKLSLTLTVSDIFNSMRFRNIINTTTLFEQSTRSRDGRIAFLGLTYHFGKTDKKKDKMEYDDNL